MNYQDILEVSDFKGHPVITIPVGYNINFAFGYSKAVNMCNYQAEITAFVTSEGKGAGNLKMVISEYKGHPILEIPSNKPKYPIRLGLSKARAVIKYINEIAAFVVDNDAKYAGVASQCLDTVSESYQDSYTADISYKSQGGEA